MTLPGPLDYFPIPRPTPVTLTKRIVDLTAAAPCPSLLCLIGSASIVDADTS